MADENQDPQRTFHKDWRMWFVVGLMLLSMLIYLLTMDESLGPAPGNSGLPVPADTPPAGE